MAEPTHQAQVQHLAYLRQQQSQNQFYQPQLQLRQHHSDLTQVTHQLETLETTKQYET